MHRHSAVHTNGSLSLRILNQDLQVLKELGGLLY
jgi:hypothetical protein